MNLRPVQVASLAIGLWWVANGIGAFLIDPNLATGSVHGGGALLGVQITVNGWHALFHLLPGILGIAAAWRPRAALAYLLGAGALYIAVGAWGLIAGGNTVGPIAVDQAGDVVHLFEGLIAVLAAVLTAPGRAAHSPIWARGGWTRRDWRARPGQQT